MTNITCVRKMGNSIGFTIPYTIRERYNIRIGDVLILDTEDWERFLRNRRNLHS